jgi:hypothetical protein
MAAAGTKPEPFGLTAVYPAHNSRVNDMSSDGRKRAFRIDGLLAGVMIASGIAVSGLSLAWLANPDQAMAQATQPLQSTPGADSKPSAPAEPATTGTGIRPSETPPQPAQPDARAREQGATPALPPAPAEKIAAPIKDR